MSRWAWFGACAASVSFLLVMVVIVIGTNTVLRFFSADDAPDFSKHDGGCVSVRFDDFDRSDISGNFIPRDWVTTREEHRDVEKKLFSRLNRRFEEASLGKSETSYLFGYGGTYEVRSVQYRGLVSVSLCRVDQPKRCRNVNLWLHRRRSNPASVADTLFDVVTKGEHGVKKCGKIKIL